MMLNMIARQHGHELAANVSDQFMHERIRDEHDQQRMALPARLGVRHPKLMSVIKLMEENLEEPLDRGKLAKSAGLSSRQLERLFRKYLNRSPARYYVELRLEPRAATAAADQHARDRRGARLRLRLGLAFLQMLPRLLRQDAAPRAHGAAAAAAD